MMTVTRVARVWDGIRRGSDIRYSEKSEKYYSFDVVDKWDCSIENIFKKEKLFTMDLWIIRKPILHISEGTSSIFHKDLEVLST